MRDLATLPKGHLHLHLEGAMRPGTLVELATEVGIPVPVVSGFGSFSVFAEMYVAACQVLSTPEAMVRLVREVVADAALAGAVWVEPAFYPMRYPHLGGYVEVLDLVLTAGLEAAAELGIGFGLMVTADRTTDPAEAVMLAHLAAERGGRGVVSFGLANDEALWPPEPFHQAFDVAYEAGLLCAPHAGELAGPESVRGALDTLHANRIQHGVRAMEDRELIARLAGEGICLDVCPTSNLLLAVVPSLEVHPLPALLAAGVRCSLNGDDPLLFGPGLLEEYQLCRDTIGLTDEQLADIALASVECSGATASIVGATRTAISAWLALPES
jgi:adenosine deaminase